LADLDQHVRQPPLLAMHRDCKVCCVVDAVGLVVADDELAFGHERIEEVQRQSAIASVGEPDLPGTAATVQDWREAVDAEQHARSPGDGALVEHFGDGAMIGAKQRLGAQRPIGRANRPIAGHDHARARNCNRFFAGKRPIAVDDQAGVAARHQRRIEKLRKSPRHFPCARIPSYVRVKLSRVQAKPGKAAGNPIRGVIADHHGAACAPGVDRL
jgi:hypothetical protein